MIVNSNVTNPEFYNVLSALGHGDIELHLTGSRFFGGNRSDSDYDFFTMETEETEAWLRDCGFTEISTTVYLDDLTFSKVLEFVSPEGCIQVQLIKPECYAKKQLAQRLLQKAFPQGLPENKLTCRELWKFAFSALDTLGING